MITVKVTMPTGLSDKLKTFQKGGEGYDTVLRTVASSVLGEMKTRIHEEGKAADGANIGSYNTTNALYVNPKNSPKSFSPIGKTGKTKFESGIKKGQSHKTKFFDSYSQFRTTIGRPVDKVNLSLTGQLNNQFVLIATDDGYGLGWNNEEMPGRAKGLETKYGKEIWALTEGEKKTVTIVANEVTNEIIDKTFGNYKY